MHKIFSFILFLFPIHLVFIKIKTFALKLVINFLYGFNSWEVVGEENIQNLVSKNKSFILVTWHGKVLAVFKYFANKN